MAAFAGTVLPEEMSAAIGVRPYAGVSLFRAANVDSPAQVRQLAAQIQTAAPKARRPLLIAIDQEGGQLNGLGDGPTPFAGPMAHGAAGDAGLTQRVARAMGLEMHAMGVNVDYAPTCDLATSPENPALGIRCFGDDPEAVGELAAAFVRGLQSAGVAATVKHFPGMGEGAVDTHHGLAVLPASREQFETRELVPFRAAIAAGARLAMTGHASAPALSGDADLPSSLAPAIVGDLLRRRLGFDGLTITDALDMHALPQGAAQVVDIISAVRAGQDLLLATPDPVKLARIDEGLGQAELRGLLPDGSGALVQARLAALRAWLRSFEQPELEVVGRAEHLELAAELAERSVTLIRNEDGLLPLRLEADARLAVIQPQPANLTPADTTQLVAPTLAAAVRRRWPQTEEWLVASEPTATEIAALRDSVGGCDVVILGTDAAYLRPAQAELARALLDTQQPLVVVALRGPWDLSGYPAARTYACSYGVLEPTTEALAAALFGERPFAGRLPVDLTGLHPRGHRIVVN